MPIIALFLTFLFHSSFQALLDREKERPEKEELHLLLSPSLWLEMLIASNKKNPQQRDTGKFRKLKNYFR